MSGSMRCWMARCGLACALSCLVVLAGVPALARADDEAGDAEATLTDAVVDDLATQASIVSSGTFGTCPWTFDSDGVLTIGSGTLPNSTGYMYWDSLQTYEVKRVRTSGRIVAAESISGLFSSFSKMTSADLSGIDTSAVTNMSGVFRSCSSLTSIDLTGWNTSRVRDMSRLFQSCDALTSANLAGWDTTSVTDMSEMFWACDHLFDLNISGWDTPQVETMNQMFWGCRRLESIDVARWNTESLTNANQLFYFCDILGSLDLSGWNTAKVLNMESMFAYCQELERIYVGDGWSTASLGPLETYRMFDGCYKLVGGNGTKYDYSHSSADYAHVDAPDNPGYLTHKQGSAPAPSPSQGGKSSMYRLYNPYTGEHFYTASPVEKDHLANIGWSYEGIGWVAPERSKSPVYRLYNPYAGDHHYTMSAGERDNLKSVGWSDEGVGWYSDDAHGVPLYRQYNPYASVGTHNYTTSRGENDALVSIGWNAEGIGWYGVA
ncbi:BspA family leucine-rich repeat surface protein [Olsenella intestinalis]|uniref:BspA family leucine-rich repeat surface protein n=1 Tax=Olsenella intestinalis TaxID=2930083 RepID=UPI00200D9B20|nr:BspA family leucine-rich repeat surface protein [Olsenella intestinalis]